VLTYQYDALNRVIRKTVPERSGLTAAQTRDDYYDYDAMGLQTKARVSFLWKRHVVTRRTRKSQSPDAIAARGLRHARPMRLRKG
jgi:hypothetical protein